MKPSTPTSAAQLIAESIRTQLGAEAVILITPSSPKYAVVVAQPPDTDARPASGAALPDREVSDTKRGERLAYSVEEVARALGLSQELIHDQLRTGHLKSLKVGRRRIITREHIDEFLAGG